MTGQAKIELILELKNKIKSGLAEAKAKVGKDVGEMKLKLAELKASFNQSFKSMADEIPGLSTGLRLLKNPLALAGAGVFAL
ncbi:MAG: hypothetical protein LBN95_11120 [Prevotellaceae bacterium]|jgi:hypothetical protein|nr:hypothetical protein [Prevotellaceae bacterium]